MMYKLILVVSILTLIFIVYKNNPEQFTNPENTNTNNEKNEKDCNDISNKNKKKKKFVITVTV